MGIVVVGSIAFDSVKTPFGECDHTLGGAANYFSLSANFFSKVALVGVVGEDFPEHHLNYLKEKNIDTSGIAQVAGKTFHWQGEYRYDLNEPQTLKTELNVFADFSPKIPEHYRDSRTVFLANIDPTLQLSVLKQVHNPKISALDTMNFWIEGKNRELKEAISQVDILFINESELRQLAGEHNIVKAAKSMHQLGPKTVVVKRGEYGAILFHNEKRFFSPAYPLEDVFDPTGAGDTFAGGFLGWLDKCRSLDFEHLKQAMLIGTVMSSFVIEKFSFDRMKELTREEIEQRCRNLQQLAQMPKEFSI